MDDILVVVCVWYLTQTTLPFCPRRYNVSQVNSFVGWVSGGDFSRVPPQHFPPFVVNNAHKVWGPWGLVDPMMMVTWSSMDVLQVDAMRRHALAVIFIHGCGRVD